MILGPGVIFHMLVLLYSDVIFCILDWNIVYKLYQVVLVYEYILMEAWQTNVVLNAFIFLFLLLVSRGENILTPRQTIVL